MPKSRIVAIGASAGGVEALRTLVSGFSADFPAPIVVAHHLAPDSPGYLPEILARAGSLPAVNASDNEALEPGRIYVAPPDHHLLVRVPGYLRLSQGAKENRVRPSIDPLFRSVAVAFGNRAIGVILTGALDDGTAGLAAIKGCSGLTMVQDPGEAQVPSMPQSALRHVIVDHVVSVTRMADLLARLVEADPPTDLREVAAMKRQVEMELSMAAGDAGVDIITRLGDPSLFTCPECHGMLVELHDKVPLRYRCHTGHAFTATSLVAALRESTETSLWSTMRAYQETAMLLDHLAQHADPQQSPEVVAELQRHAREAQRRADQLKELNAETAHALGQAASTAIERFEHQAANEKKRAASGS